MLLLFFITLKSHQINDLNIVITNAGRIGTNGDYSRYEWSFEFPQGSGREYLFVGSLWIGAVVKECYKECYRVSYGVDGWQPYEEFSPGSQDTIYEFTGDEAVSDHDLYCIYWDTCGGTAPEYFPMGLQVHERSYAWAHGAVKAGVIIDYVIKNVGNYYLDSVHVGLYVDGDCHPVISDPWSAWFGAQDDITGLCIWRDPIDTLWPSETILYTWNGSGYTGINVSGLPKYRSVKDYILTAWIADADGYNDVYSGGPSDQPECIGCRLLGPEIPCVSYNWWLSDPDPSLDWGPSDPANPEDVNHTPSDAYYVFPDSAKYILLSNRSLDPDQIGPRGVNADPRYSWPTGVDSINDTRFLLSTGPFYLAPGESIRIAFALFGGYDFHRSYNLNDYSFDSLVNTSWKMAYFYDIPGVDTDGDGYKGDFVVIGGETAFINGDGVPDLSVPPYFPPTPPCHIEVKRKPDRNILLWNSPSPSYAYNVYRSGTSGGPYTRLNPSPIDRNIFVDSVDIHPGDTVYYVVTSIDTTELESGYSREIMVICGIPYKPLLRYVSWGDYRRICISWEGYWESEKYLVWKKGESESLWTVIDTLVNTYQIVDEDVVPGVRYDYFIQALYNGLLSSPSCTLTGLAVSMDREILLVDCSGPPEVVDDASVDSFYFSLLSPYDWTYWDNSSEDNPPPLTQLVQYKLILIQDDASPTFYIREKEDDIIDYLRAGGKMMISGISVIYGPEFVDSVIKGYYSTYFSVSLIGVNGNGEFPSLSVDTSFAEAILWATLFYSSDSTVRVIYTCDTKEDSFPEGEPCGILRLEKPGVCILGFPLSWMQRDVAEVAGRKILDALLSTGVREERKERCLLGKRIAFEVNYTIPVKIDLYDVSGRRVRRIYEGVPGKKQFVIESAGLSPGVYFIHVYGKGIRERMKFILLK